jgi:transcriptional regulator with XRE-family HTH domain
MWTLVANATDDTTSLGKEGDAMDGYEDQVRRLGASVLEARTKKNKTQEDIVTVAKLSSRHVLGDLEHGKRSPKPDELERICEALQIPYTEYALLVLPDYQQSLDFQHSLALLVGKPLSLSRLDLQAAKLAVKKIAQLFAAKLNAKQVHAAFNSVLVFYGEKAATEAFLGRFFPIAAFNNLESFRKKVFELIAVGMRLFGNFRKAWTTLAYTVDLQTQLSPLKQLNSDTFKGRTPFIDDGKGNGSAITRIPVEHLKYLGYIAVERIKKEERERAEISSLLKTLAEGVKGDGQAAIRKLSEPKRLRMSALLRQFESPLDLRPSFFHNTTSEDLLMEAGRLAPKEAELELIDRTQSTGLHNLSVYLSEPYMDVYVATSMRDDSEFVAVDNFVDRLFSDSHVVNMRLRFFNPTQSWIGDRVAKGLVEALMLRRARVCVYMAQKKDSFGKDSEASVALGQGKSVIVYVPRLFSQSSGIDSEVLWQLNDAEIGFRLKKAGIDIDDTADKQDKVQKLLESQLSSLDDDSFAEMYAAHWADFDVWEEIQRVDGELLTTEQRSALSGFISHYADGLAGRPSPLSATERRVMQEALAKVAIDFERRATTFRKIHPLALQVIADTGVLNGILVVRAADQCAKALFEVMTNSVELEVVEDTQNFTLVDKTTRKRPAGRFETRAVNIRILDAVY